MSEPEDHHRSEWGSRTAFYFACIGAAVGFGKFFEIVLNRTPAVSLPSSPRVIS